MDEDLPRFDLSLQLGTVEQQLEALRRAFDLLAAFMAEQGDPEIAELERLLNEDASLAVNVFCAITSIAAEGIMSRAEEWNQDPLEVIRHYEREFERDYDVRRVAERRRTRADRTSRDDRASTPDRRRRATW